MKKLNYLENISMSSVNNELPGGSGLGNGLTKTGTNIHNFLKSKTFRNGSLLVVFGIFMLILVEIFANYINKHPLTTINNSVSAGDPRTIQNAISTQKINQTFPFPLMDNLGKSITNFNYQIVNAEIRNEIIVNGKPAVAIKGKTFLVLSINIENAYNQAINVNAKDYVRLTLNNNPSVMYAADIHNDPVNIQAISTKPTRIGFVIDDSIKNMAILVGEIKNTNKQKITLNFK
jgi:hypothetical protein